MSQFVYLEVITAADMFHICLHPDLLDAFNSGLCPAVPRDEMECDNRAGKKTDQLFESLRFRRIACCRGSALLCRRLSQYWKTGCTCCSQTLNALLMPSFRPVCMYVLIRALLYLYHHQAFRALHQHKVFTLTCTAEEI